MKGELAVLRILLDDAGVSAVVDDKVYCYEAPQEKSLPFILVESRDVEPIDSKSGKAEIDWRIVGVFIYATTMKAASDLSELVRTALDHKAAGTYNSVVVHQPIVFLGETGFKENETNRKTYVFDQEYRLRVGV